MRSSSPKMCRLGTSRTTPVGRRWILRPLGAENFRGFFARGKGWERQGNTENPGDLQFLRGSPEDATMTVFFGKVIVSTWKWQTKWCHVGF